MKEKSDKINDQGADQSVTYEDQGLSRRSFWRAPLLGVAGIITASCGAKTSFHTTQRNQSSLHPSDAVGGPGNAFDAEAKPTSGEVPRISIDCDPYLIETEMLSSLAELDESLEPPQMKLFVYNSSYLVVISWDESLKSKKLSQLTLVDSNGKSIFTESIAQERYREEGSLRPLQVDHIPIKTNDVLYLLITLDGVVFKYKLGLRDELEVKEFRDKPVVNLSAHHVPSDFTANQAIANFGVPTDYQGFEQAADERYSFANRRLLSAQPGAVFSGANRLSGFVITDIDGVVLAENGADFSALLEHQTLICYKDGGSHWYRTIVTVG